MYNMIICMLFLGVNKNTLSCTHCKLERLCNEQSTSAMSASVLHITTVTSPVTAGLVDANEHSNGGLPSRSAGNYSKH